MCRRSRRARTPPRLPSLRRLWPWQALGKHFRDQRLRQLFGRYATYCGCSPFAAPATLMLVAHVEQDGVWLVRGGMSRVAAAIRELAESQGASFRFGAHVAEIMVDRGRAAGVVLADGERIDADAVVFNGDPAALEKGLLGADVQRSIPRRAVHPRSLSAWVWSFAAEPKGADLIHHNVFFNADPAQEFGPIAQGKMPQDGTLYICAQDRARHDWR
jgi:1-hydroxycarotenoid 3,4-desaturase